MTHRYFVPELPTSGGSLSLSDAEAQHAVRVMRVQVGEQIELFDGIGNASQATIVEINRNQCSCEAMPAETVSREPGIAIELAISLPKPDRARELIERLTELGVRSVTPLIAERTQRPPSASLLDKLSRGIIEACKQSGRNHLMSILETCVARDYFAQSRDGVKLIAHPLPGSSKLGDFAAATVTAAIGPEGGWSGNEIHRAVEGGFQPIDLGRRIYRIETAAVAVAAVLVNG